MTTPETSSPRGQLLYIGDEWLGLGIMWQLLEGVDEVGPEDLQNIAMHQIAVASDRLAQGARQEDMETDDLPTVTWGEDRCGFEVFPHVRVVIFSDWELCTGHWRINGGEWGSAAEAAAPGMTGAVQVFQKHHRTTGGDDWATQSEPDTTPAAVPA